VRRAALLLALLAACSSKSSGGDDHQPKTTPTPETAQAGDAAPAGEVQLPPAPPVARAPLGLPATPSPSYNPTTPAKVALGRKLFFDVQLSAAGTMACAHCHDPQHGWGDPRRLSETAGGKLNLRHAPALANVAYAHELYWDGRVKPLEALILANWKGQMGANPDAIARRLGEDRLYEAHFRRAFDSAPTGDHTVEALAAFVRTIRSGDAPWDRYENGDRNAVGPDVVAGAALFRGKAQCGVCHPPPMYTDQQYYAVGVGDPARDPGRMIVTGSQADRGAFRTPTLRGAAESGPYFHDGSAPTLEAVVDHFLGGASGREPIVLTPDERAQLLAFVRALTP